LLTASLAGPVLYAQDGPKIKHVLVISIDGMHSQDLAKWISANPSSNLAALAATGVNYPSAFSTLPSDSIPSTVGIFSGASASLGGMYYDDAWHRVWSPPGSNCSAKGTLIDLKQGIDFTGTALDAGGGINPNNLPRNLDSSSTCVPVYPHQMIRVNTIFEVVKAAGMYTAYSEKRPAYDFLNGPSGAGVQDLYVPEINAVTLLNPSQIEGFDTLRVNSILNEINGLSHDGTKPAPQPALFGMNFQAVNSAKKTSPNSGYTDLTGDFDSYLLPELQYVDHSIGLMLSAMAQQGLTNSTVVIITAKHGESPVGNQRTTVSPTLIGTILSTAGITVQKTTQKTSELIWLPRKDALGNPLTTDQVRTQTANAVAVLNTAALPGGKLAGTLRTVLSFNSGPVFPNGTGLPFPDPTVDPAVPDIVVVMNDGVNFEPTSNGTLGFTYADHGGFGENETHVPLLVSYPTWSPVSVSGSVTVATRQIAPTVLSMLGLDPTALDAVRIEGIGGLPEVIAKLDTTPPVIVATVAPSPNVNGWNNSDVSVSWSVADPESGIASSAPGCLTTSVKTETAGTVLTCSAINGAGLPKSVSATVKLDKTAPSVVPTATPLPNGNNWNNSPVTVAFIGTDILSGLDTCTAPVTVNTEGAGQSSSSGTCTDKAGNMSTPVSKTGINIDLTAPTITFAGRTPANANGWNNTAVTLNWNCADALSGVVSSTVSVTLTADGANQSATGTCQDKAGNHSSDTQTGINIDHVPPVLIVPASVVANATSPSGANVSFTVTVSDALDPSPLVICNPSAGSIFPIGNTNSTCTATDRAGNSSSGSFVVTVKGATDQVNDLLTLVTSLNLSTLGSSLTSKLQNIQSQLSSWQTSAVCGQLTAFINDVTAQSGQGLTLAQANQLIAAAAQIQAVIGGC